MTSDTAPAEDDDASKAFLILDQAPAEPRRRPWARCLGCGHRIWSATSLLHRRGRQCRGPADRRHGHGRSARAWRYVTGQTDLLTSKETSMTTTTVDVADIAAVFVADTLDDSGIDVTTRYGLTGRPEVTVIFDGKPFRLRLTQLPETSNGR